MSDKNNFGFYDQESGIGTPNVVVNPSQGSQLMNSSDGNFTNNQAISSDQVSGYISDDYVSDDYMSESGDYGTYAKGDTGPKGKQGPMGIGLRGPTGGLAFFYFYDSSGTTTPASGYWSANGSNLYFNQVDEYGNTLSILTSIKALDLITIKGSGTYDESRFYTCQVTTANGLTGSVVSFTVTTICGTIVFNNKEGTDINLSPTGVTGPSGSTGTIGWAVKVTKTYQDIQTSGSLSTLTLFAMNDGDVLHEIIGSVVTKFTSSDVAMGMAFTVYGEPVNTEIINSSGNAFSSLIGEAVGSFATPSDGDPGRIGPVVPFFGNGNSVTLQALASGGSANLNNLTAGVIRFDALKSNCKATSG